MSTPSEGQVQACLERGLALKGRRQLEGALAAFEEALALQSDFVPGLVNRAATLLLLGRSHEALESSERAIGLAPEFALNALGRSLEALESYDRALTLDPDYLAALGNRGKALQALNRPEEALAAYRRVIRLAPDAAQAYVNASHTLLSLGRFEEGWAFYEWRKRLPSPLGNREFPKPVWLGGPAIRGKRLLLHFEQGLGDTIQFCRYAVLARAQGASVVLMVQRSLRRLVATLCSDIDVITEGEAPGEFDYHCPLLSLPLAFGTQITSIPARTPYLAAEPVRVAHWRARLGYSGFKVGINWQGNGRSPVDRGRSFPVSVFASLASIPQVRLISLQKGTGAEQLTSLPNGMRVESFGEFDTGSDAFVDTAAIMQCLDLVITSDTAVAHLAGALARPTWVALAQVADWRWLTERADCPWYPAHRLFRQKEPGRWDLVFDTIRAELLRQIPPG